MLLILAYDRVGFAGFWIWAGPHLKDLPERVSPITKPRV